MRETLPSPKFVAQTAPAAAARRSGVSPTRMRERTRRLAGSRTTTLPPLASATYSADRPASRPTGPSPAGSRAGAAVRAVGAAGSFAVPADDPQPATTVTTRTASGARTPIHGSCAGDA